jgi:hypothetical protein
LSNPQADLPDIPAFLDRRKGRQAGAGAAPKSSWRDVLPVHPAADLLPLLPPDELKALSADIAAHGLRNTPSVYIDGDPNVARDCRYFLVDGRNRLDAMALADPKFKVVVPKRGDQLEIHFQGRTISFGYYVEGGDDRAVGHEPHEIVASENLFRRHLTADQKRDLIAKLIKATPNKSDRQIAEQTKASPSTVGTIRKSLEKSGEVSKLDTRTDKKGVKQPAKKPSKSKSKLDVLTKEIGDFLIPVLAPAKSDPVGSPPVRYSEPAATSGTPEIDAGPDELRPKVERWLSILDQAEKLLATVWDEMLDAPDVTIPESELEYFKDDLEVMAHRSRQLRDEVISRGDAAKVADIHAGAAS